MSGLTRRGLIGALICAPAIVRAGRLMPIKALPAGTPSGLVRLGPGTYEATIVAVRSTSGRLLSTFEIVGNDAIKAFEQGHRWQEKYLTSFELNTGSGFAIGDQVKISL